MKKISEMPWDDPDFVEAMRKAFYSGHFMGTNDGNRKEDWEEFVSDVEKGYED